MSPRKKQYREFMSRFRIRCKASIDRIEYLNKNKFCLSDVDIAEINCHSAFLLQATKEFYNVGMPTIQQRKAFLEMFND